MKKLDDYNLNKEILPFNANKWNVEKIRSKKLVIEVCYSRDYMTNRYTIIPFYKPIFPFINVVNE